MEGLGGGLAEGSVIVGLSAVIVAVTDEQPRILTVQRDERPLAEPSAEGLGGDLAALPFGPLDPQRDRTLELALRRWVREQAGLELGYVEQLYTFGDRDRNPWQRAGGPRVISIGYLALAVEGEVGVGRRARWRDWYGFFPWEDWRGGRPAILGERLETALSEWVGVGEGDTRRRRDRVDIAFGLSGSPWDGERVLERYELLYESNLVGEAAHDRALRGGGSTVPGAPRRLGRAMSFDHRRILATALSRLRGKLRYRPVVFELLPSAFTLLQLQRVVEALAGVRLHKQNFRRLVERGGLVEGTGRVTAETGGRPAELFTFRREVLRERPTPGVGLPGLPRP